MKLYEIPEITEVNRMPASGIVIPPERRFPLDGQWDFKLFPAPENVPEFKDIRWDKITVPANWTLENCGDLPIYTNVQMPFDNNPPIPPAANPTGIYRKNFTLPENFAGKRVVLHLGGVESYFELYINDRFAGMGKDTRLPSEFDVTGFLVPGENSIECKVLRFSDSSYIEYQDQWWMAGIYRTVYLYATGPVFFEDFAVNGDYDHTTGKGILHCYSHLGFELSHFLPAGPQNDFTVKYTLLSPAGETVDVREKRVAAKYRIDNYIAEVEIEVPQVSGWSAETPVLYSCRAELFDYEGNLLDQQEKRCGFRRVEICGSELLINGKRVMIKGVNRHEHDCRKGKTLDMAGMMSDIRLLKQFNFNAVRTCHYPDDERWYDLCDEYGIYVLDEANIEAHANYAMICRDPRWKNAFISRVERMILRDRSHVSIIGWSLGNESGHGENHLAAAAVVRALDTSRFLHHEGEGKQGWQQNSYDFDTISSAHNDIFCGMYTSPEDLQKYDLNPQATRPAILCEYAHQMGNSGSLADYWEVFHAGKKLQGGFIWDWVDQGLEKFDENGKLFYAYGGDFGEKIHDEDFCCNGLLAPDRTLHPGMFEFRHLVQDVTVTPLGKMEFLLTSRRDFTALGDLSGSYTIEVNGRKVVSGEISELKNIPPRGTMKFHIPTAGLSRKADEEVFVNFAFTAAVDLPAIPAGTLLAHDQADITAEIPAASLPETAADTGEISLYKENGKIVLANGKTAVEVTLDNGQVRLLHAGKVVADQLFACNIFRAPVENDGVPFRMEWQPDRPLAKWIKAGFHQAQDQLLAAESGNGFITLVREISVAAGKMRFTQQFAADGAGFTVTQHYEIPENFPAMPRIGVITSLTEMEEFEYFGRGPWENYIDRNRASQVSRYRSSAVLNSRINYCVPQENGNRTDTREVILYGDGCTLSVTGKPHFEFGVSKYTAGELFAARHPCELTAHRETFLTLDLKQQGMGSSACGPKLPEKYTISGKEYTFEFAFAVKSR